MAKQNALQLLSYSLADMRSTNFDIILASILLFINFELIESGKDSGRIHVEGAKSLIGCIISSSSTSGPQTEISNMSPLKMAFSVS